MKLDIRYVRSGGAAIAYQVVGNGPIDLVVVPDYVSNLVYAWESRHVRAFYERLSSFSRLILFDKRGTGLSDHTGGFPPLEARMEDLRAVLEAVGSRKAVLLGAHEGCGMACLFAASYPERTRALVLFQPVAFFPECVDELGALREEAAADLAELRARWGTQEFSEELLADFAPSLAAQEDERHWFCNYLRVSASPSAAYALNRMYYETDLRDILPAIRVPTLLLSRGEFAGERVGDFQRRISDSQVLRLPGDDFGEMVLSPEIPSEIERFLAGAEAESESDRVLTTVLFTDLVEATALAAKVGDEAWRNILQEHTRLLRREIARFRGREVDTAGDGVFASFDGPARAIRCADAIRTSLRHLGLEVRAGVHTGECEIVGNKPAGIAVHIGSRVAASANAGEILASSTVRDLVAGSGITFEDRGVHKLKGVPDEWRLFRVTGT